MVNSLILYVNSKSYETFAREKYGKQFQYLHNDYRYTNYYGRCNSYENNVHHAYLITYTYYLLGRSNWNLR